MLLGKDWASRSAWLNPLSASRARAIGTGMMRS